MACQDLGREDLHQLIAEQDPTLAVHHANTIAIAIERHAHLSALGLHRADEVGQIGRFSRVWMMIGESTIDLGIQQLVSPR